MKKLFASLAAMAASGGIARAQDEPILGIAHNWQIGFQRAATPVMQRLENLHNHLLLVIITAITLFVLALLAYIVLRFNARSNPIPSRTAHNTVLEIAWTVVPIVILVVIAIPSLRDHYYMERDPHYQMTLKVVGHQWYWSYEYPDQGGFGFDSYIVKDQDLKPGQHRLLAVDNRAVVPVNTVIRVQITGADVIHSWSVPAFGVKRDAVPGRLNETWFKAERPGIYYGQCSQLCGVGHGFMPIAVEVVSAKDFDSWARERQRQAHLPVTGAAKVSSAAPSVPVPEKPLPPGSPENPTPGNVAPQAPATPPPAKPLPLVPSEPAHPATAGPAPSSIEPSAPTPPSHSSDQKE